MYITCGATALLALMGNICMRCRVTHIFCVMLLCIPMGVVVPALCVYGFVVVQAPIVNEEHMMITVVKYWQKTGKVWPYLETMQRYSECCGIDGPMDYRRYIYNRQVPAGGGKICEEEEHDIPITCINLHRHYDKCWQYKRDHYCNVLKLTRDTIVFNEYTLNDKLKNMTAREKARFKCHHLRKFDSGATLNIYENLNESIWTEVSVRLPIYCDSRVGPFLQAKII